jgi:hypothetical protein
MLPKVGDRDDYECPRCLAFSVAGTWKQAIKDGRRATLVQGIDGRMWLRPVAWRGEGRDEPRHTGPSPGAGNGSRRLPNHSPVRAHG